MWTCVHPSAWTWFFVTFRSKSEHRVSRSSPLVLHSPIPCLPMTKGHFSFSLRILALKSPVSNILSARRMAVGVEAYLYSSGFVIAGAYTLIIVAKLFLLRGSLIVMILSLTGRGISVSFVRISFLIAKPTLASSLSPSGLPLQKKEYSKSSRLRDPENLVSHRAAMSMLYLASCYIATSAVRLPGRSAPSRSRRVLTFHCAIVSSCLLFLLTQGTF